MYTSIDGWRNENIYRGTWAVWVTNHAAYHVVVGEEPRIWRKSSVNQIKEVTYRVKVQINQVKKKVKEVTNQVLNMKRFLFPFVFCNLLRRFQAPFQFSSWGNASLCTKDPLNQFVNIFNWISQIFVPLLIKPLLWTRIIQINQSMLS